MDVDDSAIRSFTHRRLSLMHDVARGRDERERCPTEGESVLQRAFDHAAAFSEHLTSRAGWQLRRRLNFYRLTSVGSGIAAIARGPPVFDALDRYRPSIAAERNAPTRFIGRCESAADPNAPIDTAAFQECPSHSRAPACRQRQCMIGRSEAPTTPQPPFNSLTLPLRKLQPGSYWWRKTAARETHRHTRTHTRKRGG